MFKPSSKLEKLFNDWEAALNKIAELDFEPSPTLATRFKCQTIALVGLYIEESFIGDSLADDCSQFAELVKQIKPMIEFAAA